MSTDRQELEFRLQIQTAQQAGDERAELAARQGLQGFLKPVEAPPIPSPRDVLGEVASPQRDIGPGQAFLISAGRGLTNVARGVGLAEPEPEITTEQFEELKQIRPVATTTGEVLGEAAPFLVPGTGIAGLTTRGGRIIAATALGATEGAIITRGRGADQPEVLTGAGVGGVVGGVAEAALPVLGRVVGAFFRRVTGRPPRGALIDEVGNPTPELSEALEQTGQSFDDLSAEAVEEFTQQAGKDPQEVARLTRLQELGAPATRGDISQEFGQQAAEARLVESAADPIGDPIRALRLEQSRAFQSVLDEDIASLGVADDVGESIKDALTGRKKLLSNEKNRLYREAAETAPEIQKLPIITDSISESIPSSRELRRLSRIQGNQAGAVDDLLTEFGVVRDPQKVDDFIKAGGEIEPLNVGNFEEFRQALNQIERADTTGSTSVIIGPIRNALDSEADLIDDALRAGGVTDESILAPLKEARATVRQIKTEFSPQAITGRLIDVKRDGVTPVIEASKAFDQILAPKAAPELLDRTLESLRAAGPKGEKGIGDLQARTVLELIDSAFKAQSRKIAGERVFGAIPYNNRLEQFGAARLDNLFQNKPAVLRRLRDIGEAAKDITPPAAATPKGSASVILDTLNNLGIMTILGRIPGGGVFRNIIASNLEGGASREAIRTALRANPKSLQAAGFIEKELPNLASALGIAGISQEITKE